MTAKTGNFKNRNGTVHVGHLLDDGRLGHLVCGANGAYGPSRRGNFQPTTDEATCKRCLKITAPAEPAPADAEPAAAPARMHCRTFSATTRHIVNPDESYKTLCGHRVSLPQVFTDDDGNEAHAPSWMIVDLPPCERCERSASKRQLPAAPEPAATEPAPAEPAPAEPAATEPAPAGPLTTGGMVRDSVTGRLAKVTALDHGVVAVQFLNPVAKTIRYVDQLTPVHPCPRCKWCDGTWLLTVVRRTAGGTPKVTRFDCTAELRDGLDAYGVPRGAWRDGFYGLRGERYEWRRLNTQS